MDNSIGTNIYYAVPKKAFNVNNPMLARDPAFIRGEGNYYVIYLCIHCEALQLGHKYPLCFVETWQGNLRINIYGDGHPL